MKTLASSFFLIIVFMLLLESNSLICQWIDKGDYKELEVSTTTPRQLISPIDENYFYILTSDNYFKKFNLDGFLQSNIKLVDAYDGFKLHSINNDGKYNFYSIFHSREIDRIIMFDSETGDSVWDHELIENSGIGLNGNQQFDYITYNRKSSFLIFSHSTYFDNNSTTSGWKFNRRFGITYFKKTLQDTLQEINEGYVEICETDIYQTRYLFLGLWSWEQGRPYYIPPYINACSTNLTYYMPINGLLVSNKKNWGPYSEYENNKTSYRLKNQSDGFIEILKNTIKFYDIIDKKIVLHDSCKIEFEPVYIIYSANDKYLIANDDDNTIWIIDVESRNVIRKYPGIVGEKLTELKLTIPGNGFFVTTDKGKIRLYEIQMLTKVSEQKKQIEIIVSPNPASDYIEISYPLLPPGKGWGEGIRIFDMLGVEVLVNSQLSIVNSQLRIDVSSLSPGVYFVRASDVVRKFVKM